MLVLGIGVLVVAHPLYLMPHFGQGVLYMHVHGTDSGSAPDDTVAYSDLPSSAQAAFDTARREDSVQLYTVEDEAAIDALRSHSAVRYRGTYYSLSWSHTDAPWLFAGVFRLLLSLVGGLVVAIGSLAIAADDLRPFTPRRTLALPPLLVAAAGVQGLVDWMRLGRRLLSAPFFALLVAVPLVGFALLGSALRRGDRRVALLGALIAGTILGLATLFHFFRMGTIFSVLLGLPTAIVTYGLTAPESRSAPE